MGECVWIGGAQGVRKTELLKMNIIELSDKADPEAINENTRIAEAAIANFGKLMEEYGYTKRKDVDSAKGTKTITVTVGAACPVAASLVAVFSKVGGDTVVEVTTTIGDNVEKMKHTMSKDGTGKGEGLNG